jgi:hypothetical protein
MNINIVRCNMCEKEFDDIWIRQCDQCGTDSYLADAVGELWIAHLSTANFDFYLIAETETVMWEKLELSWNNHAEKTNATYTWEDIKDSVWYNRQIINNVWKRG